MKTPEKPDRKLFWLMILLGSVCAGFGAALAWLDYAAAKWVEERSTWVSGEALLYEVGIRYSNARNGSNYEMTARYTLRVDGRDYEGSEIARGYYSQSALQVRSLIVPFAPEAAAFNVEDLGVLNPQRTWRVGFRTVPARYDPRDPARSQMLLENPIVIKTVGSWVSRGITLILLLVGAALLVFAWPAASGRRWGKQKYQLPAGPALSRYPEADRRRLLLSIERLQAEISRLSLSGWTTNLRLYARQIEEMAAAARDGSFVLLHYANQGLGRGADEVFGDEKLVDAAYTLQACINEMVKQRPRPGRALST